MVHMAQTYPDIGLIGCEPFVNGVAMLLGKIRKAGVQNLRVHPGDVRDLFDVLPDACVERCFLLYPDPWPKARHARNRIINPAFARLVDGSEFDEFKPGFGPGTLCLQAQIHGITVGLLANNGPIDPAGANKATHFIQACDQALTQGSKVISPDAASFSASSRVLASPS